MKILIAPNSFKECASSVDVADFIYHLLKKNEVNQLIRFPISDGGDGFLYVCKENFGLRISHKRIRLCYDNKFIPRIPRSKLLGILGIKQNQLQLFRVRSKVSGE